MGRDTCSQPVYTRRDNDRQALGIGDELMAAGRAYSLSEEHGQPVSILGKDMKPRRHHIWDGMGHIVQPPGESAYGLQDCGWHRPYIDYKHSTPQRWAFKRYGPRPAPFELSEAEMAWAAPYEGAVICEPRVKAGASVNKQWGKWANLKPELERRGFNVLYLGTDIDPPSIRHAAALMLKAKGSVLPEGGLHHMAAAVGAPNVVVLFGHYISPEVTGYPSQTSISAGDGYGCGWRTVECEDCASFWDNLSENEVADTLCKIIEG